MAAAQISRKSRLRLQLPPLSNPVATSSLHQSLRRHQSQRSLAQWRSVGPVALQKALREVTDQQKREDKGGILYRLMWFHKLFNYMVNSDVIVEK